MDHSAQDPLLESTLAVCIVQVIKKQGNAFTCLHWSDQWAYGDVMQIKKTLKVLPYTT